MIPEDVTKVVDIFVKGHVQNDKQIFQAWLYESAEGYEAAGIIHSEVTDTCGQALHDLLCKIQDEVARTQVNGILPEEDIDG